MVAGQRDGFQEVCPDGGHRSRDASVAILLCTFNGEAWLGEQLASFESQLHRRWTLHVSDDGSTDRTLDLLDAFAEQVGAARVRVRRGAGAGSSANFLGLACDPSIEADFYAFADQDDIWHPDRLERSIARLADQVPDRPALSCARTRYVDQDGRPVGLSPLFGRAPEFRNALVQSIAGGNTMTFNRAAHSLIVSAGLQRVVVHDWWLYLLVTGSGGVVFYDPVPTVDYRQHGGNQIGSADGWSARFSRFAGMLRGHFADWNDVNDSALQRVESLLTDENRRVLASFRRARYGGLVPRLRALFESGVWRQTFAQNFGLWVCALTNRL